MGAGTSLNGDCHPGGDTPGTEYHAARGMSPSVHGGPEESVSHQATRKNGARNTGVIGERGTEAGRRLVDPGTRGAEGHRARWLKGVFLLAFLAAAVAAVRWPPVRDWLAPEALERLIAQAGPWAPLAFVLTYVAGVCLFVPATVLTAMAVVLFGTFRGFVWAFVGALAGSSASFWIGRALGRDLAASLAGDRLRRYDDAIARNGFATVLYLRLIYLPFTPANYGMGLTKVRFRDYFAATALGIAVGTFLFVFFAGTIRDVWVRGRWDELLSPRALSAAALFVFSFFIPKLVRKLTGGTIP
jgi:uncharacterized membrane protein YdjX (TVP38/TMEM64 family)